ncbi:hypothetical protein [Nitrospira sp. Nam74]
MFPVFLLLPGYIIANALDIWEFRLRSLPTRVALALVLSISVTPGLAYLLSRFFSLKVACAVFVIGALVFLAFVGMRGFSNRGWPPMEVSRLVRRSTITIIAWMGIAIFLLSDFEMSGHLYPNVVSYDYAMRVAVTSSIMRTGVPPINPSFYPGHPLELYYYYFWFLTCSLVGLLGAVVIEPRAAVIAGTAWIGAGVVAIVALYVRFLARPRHLASDWSVFVAPALLLVSGLDIVPLFIKYVSHYVEGQIFLYPTAEWWNEQVTAWPTAILWVPHHVAGFIAALTAFLVFSSLIHVHNLGKRVLMIVVCGLAFFSALGLSIWVTFTFAVFWVAWVMLSLIKGWHMEARSGIWVAVLAFCLSIPYLLDLQRANFIHVSPIAVSVRHFMPIYDVMRRHEIDSLLLQAIDLLALPVNYFIEFGVFALAGVFYWKWRVRLKDPLHRNEIAFLTLAISAIAIATFLRSNIANNDLGWRSAMFTQFTLLIWAAPVVQSVFDSHTDNVAIPQVRLSGKRVTLLLVILLLGTAPVLYDVVMMKLYPMSGDLQLPGYRMHGFLDEQDLGRRYYDFRQAYQWIDNELPQSAVLQHNPNVYIDLPSGLYGYRQVVAADDVYGTLFGVPPGMYHPVMNAVAPVFSSGSTDVKAASEICRRFGITALVVKDTDPIWKHPESWVFKESPSYANYSSKVFHCRRLRNDAEGRKSQEANRTNGESSISEEHL